MAPDADARTVPGAARARHRTTRREPAQSREARRHVRLRGLRSAVVFIRDEIRERNRLAKLLGAARARGGVDHRSQPGDDALRDSLRALRWTPGPRVPRWPQAKRDALLHERRRPEVSGQGLASAFLHS